MSMLKIRNGNEPPSLDPSRDVATPAEHKTTADECVRLGANLLQFMEPADVLEYQQIQRLAALSDELRLKRKTLSTPEAQAILTAHMRLETIEKDNVVYVGPLRLSFELLMKRSPNLPGEGDIVMTDQQILYIAQRQE